MKKHHDVHGLSFKNGRMSVRIDGKVHSFELSAVSKKLARATISDRMKFEVSPSGYGIHWLALDEDLSIDGLLGIVHVPHHATKAAS